MGVLGKLGDVLNADVGNLVKDAGKVLNADVGDIVKGAGKALNTDVGDIVKGAGTLLKTDLGDLVGGRARSGGPDGAETPSALPAAAEAALVRGPETSQRVTQPGPNTNTGPISVKVTEDLVTRKGRPMPDGRSLANLLPVTIGPFRRDPDKPTGEIAGDGVSATYLDGSEIIVVELAACWDHEEAIGFLADAQSHAGSNCRIAQDYSWLIGQGEKGALMAWVRDSYYYSILAPKGPPSLVRFAMLFPY